MTALTPMQQHSLPWVILKTEVDGEVRTKVARLSTTYRCWFVHPNCLKCSPLSSQSEQPPWIFGGATG